MTNLEKLNGIFEEVFGVKSESLNDSFGKDNIDAWDSVHQLNIISYMEESFDLMLEPEDIMACTSYPKAKEILKNNGIEL